MKKQLLLLALFVLSFGSSALAADPPVDSKGASAFAVETIEKVSEDLAPAEAEFLASVDSYYAETFETADLDEPFVVYGLDGQPLEEGQGQPQSAAAFLFEDAGTAYYIVD